MQELLKKGESKIGGTWEKLPNYLKKVHDTIQRGGSMQDAMIFEKTIEMQAKNSDEL